MFRLGFIESWWGIYSQGSLNHHFFLGIRLHANLWWIWGNFPFKEVYCLGGWPIMIPILRFRATNPKGFLSISPFFEEMFVFFLIIYKVFFAPSKNCGFSRRNLGTEDGGGSSTASWWLVGPLESVRGTFWTVAHAATGGDPWGRFEGIPWDKEYGKKDVGLHETNSKCSPLKL